MKSVELEQLKELIEALEAGLLPVDELLKLKERILNGKG